MGQMAKFRIDKWLWAVRIFKTRAISTDACNSGKVKIDGKSIKPSRSIKLNETITVQKGIVKFVYEVSGLIEKRVSAKIASEKLIEYAQQHEPILFVCHGFINRFIAQHLLKTGWTGPKSPGKDFWEFGIYQYSV